MYSADAKAGGAVSHVPAALCINASGSSPFVLICEHASNRLPQPYGDLGLSLVQRLMHIAWDPGALAVALRLSEQLDAPLVHSTVSRLVIDCNRAPEAIDLVPTISERTRIPGNAAVSGEERAQRLERFHVSFHKTVERLLDQRMADGRPTILVTIHSFTPIYKDKYRPWPVGLIHAADTSLATALRDSLAVESPSLNIGWNEPYSALGGVTYTLERHADRRAIPSTMIELRHDEILEPLGITLWAGRLGRALEVARMRMETDTRGAAPAGRTAASGG